jgi:hypothetical protein
MTAKANAGILRCAQNDKDWGENGPRYGGYRSIKQVLRLRSALTRAASLRMTGISKMRDSSLRSE